MTVNVSLSTDNFVCKRCTGRTVKHHAMNDVARAFTPASIPVTKEPNGLSRLDGKDQMDSPSSRGKVVSH